MTKLYYGTVTILVLLATPPASAQVFMVEDAGGPDLMCEGVPKAYTEQQRYYWLQEKINKRQAAVIRASNNVLLQGGTNAAAGRAARVVADQFEDGDRECAFHQPAPKRTGPLSPKRRSPAK